MDALPADVRRAASGSMPILTVSILTRESI